MARSRLPARLRSCRQAGHDGAEMGAGLGRSQILGADVAAASDAHRGELATGDPAADDGAGDPGQLGGGGDGEQRRRALLAGAVRGRWGHGLLPRDASAPAILELAAQPRAAMFEICRILGRHIVALGRRRRLPRGVKLGPQCIALSRHLVAFVLEPAVLSLQGSNAVNQRHQPLIADRFHLLPSRTTTPARPWPCPCPWPCCRVRGHDRLECGYGRGHGHGWHALRASGISAGETSLPRSTLRAGK